MARIVFHGPHDDKDCRKVVTKLAKELGGKFSYTSFWFGRWGVWLSSDTVDKSAYSIQLVLDPYDPNSRGKLAKMLRVARSAQNNSLRLRHFTF